MRIQEWPLPLGRPPPTRSAACSPRSSRRRCDENPTGIASIEEMRFVENLLRTSDKIASRYGAIKALASAHSFDFDAAGHPLKGDFMFNVEGSRKSEYIFIHWDRNSETAPIEIIKVGEGRGPGASGASGRRGAGNPRPSAHLCSLSLTSRRAARRPVASPILGIYRSRACCAKSSGGPS